MQMCTEIGCGGFCSVFVSCFSKVIFFFKSIYDHTYNLSLKLAEDSAVFLLQNKLSCIFFDFHTQVTWV